MSDDDKDLIEALRLQGWNDAADRIEELERDLAKAVKALQFYSCENEACDGCRLEDRDCVHCGWTACAVLAELEGKKC
jgi:hypothetical protein